MVESERGAELQINQSKVFGGRKEMYELQDEYYKFNKSYLNDYDILISKEVSTANHIPPAILKTMQSDMRLSIKQDVEALDREIPKGREVFYEGELHYLLNQKEYSTLNNMVETQKHEITREHQIEYLDEKLSNYDNLKEENTILKQKNNELEIENALIIENVEESQNELILDLENTQDENTSLKEKVKQLEYEEAQRLAKIKKMLEEEQVEKMRRERILKELYDEEERRRLNKIMEDLLYRRSNDKEL